MFLSMYSIIKSGNSYDYYKCQRIYWGVSNAGRHLYDIMCFFLESMNSYCHKELDH